MLFRPFQLSRSLIPVLLTLVLLLGATSYWFIFRGSPVSEYTTTTLQTQDLQQTLDLSGFTQADTQAILRFQTPGKLGWVGYKTGDTVKKYHTIASLDKSILNKQLQKELNNYVSNKSGFDQYRDDNQVVSDDFINQPHLTPEVIRELNLDRYSLQNAALTVEIQDITNRLASIVSPIDGVLIQAAHEVAGVNVAATDTWTVIDPTSLYFQAQVDETDIGLLSLGQSATIILDAFPDTPLSTTLEYIDFSASVGESGSTVYHLKFPLPPDKIDYRLGLNGDVNILLNQKQSVTTLPLDCIIQRDNQYFVQVLENHKTQEIKVQVGIDDGESIEITSGLNSSDQVIVPQ